MRANATVIRVFALLAKEARQLLRDRTTLGMLLGIPILQIVLFGCAIELSPRSLEVTVVSADPQTGARMEHLLASTRGLVRVLSAPSLSAARTALSRGATLLVVDADVRPRIVYLDATDPVLAAHAELMMDRLLRSISSPVEEDVDARPLQVVRL